MEITANQAPKTLVEANQIIELLKKENEGLHQHNEKLIFQIKNFISGKYGKKSEKLPEGYTQLTVFGLAEKNESIPANEETIQETAKQETITYTRKKRNGHRNRPKDLPVVRINYELKDLTCPCGCGKQLYKIGEVITEQLEMVPAKIFVGPGLVY